MNALLQALASCRGFVEAAATAAAAGAPLTATGAALREFAARCQAPGAPATDSAARVLSAVLADRARLGYPPGAFGPGQQSASEALTFAVGLADAADAPGSAPWASRVPPVAPGPIAAAFAFRFDARRDCRRCGARGTMPAPAGVVLPAFGAAWRDSDTAARFAAVVAADGAPGGEPAPGFVCEGCGVAGATAVTRRLRRAPPVLVLAFNQYGDKFAPAFPPAFSLPRRDGGALVYRAAAQVVHQGGLGGGHYWAIARRASAPGGAESVFVLNDGYVGAAPEFATTYAGAPPGIVGLRDRKSVV